MTLDVHLSTASALPNDLNPHSVADNAVRLIFDAQDRFCEPNWTEAHSLMYHRLTDKDWTTFHPIKLCLPPSFGARQQIKPWGTSDTGGRARQQGHDAIWSRAQDTNQPRHLRQALEHFHRGRQLRTSCRQQNTDEEGTFRPWKLPNAGSD